MPWEKQKSVWDIYFTLKLRGWCQKNEDNINALCFICIILCLPEWKKNKGKGFWEAISLVVKSTGFGARLHGLFVYWSIIDIIISFRCAA